MQGCTVSNELAWNAPILAAMQSHWNYHLGHIVHIAWLALGCTLPRILFKQGENISSCHHKKRDCLIRLDLPRRGILIFY